MTQVINYLSNIIGNTNKYQKVNKYKEIRNLCNLIQELVKSNLPSALRLS